MRRVFRQTEVLGWSGVAMYAYSGFILRTLLLWLLDLLNDGGQDLVYASWGRLQ